MSTYPSPYNTSTNLGESQTRRRRGAIRLNCAECRRLKLRCDRGTPCSSCVKRGCGAICPEGSLTTGQGNRFVLASTEELHEKILELCYRIRALEDALRSEYAKLSTEPHPLLSEELLKIKSPMQRELPSRSGNIKEEEGSQDVGEAFSMTVQTSGKSRYYGHIANSWYFLQNDTEEEEEGIDETFFNLQLILSHEILQRASAMPISRFFHGDEVGLRNLRGHLPSSAIAYELRTVYYSHAAWMYNPITTEVFDAQVYSMFYSSNAGANLTLGDQSLGERLALMFMVLAIGSLMDTTLAAYNLEAEKYYQLARAALFHSSILDAPTLHVVQALFLMSYYLFLSERHGTPSEARWLIMGIAVKVGQSIGLHRDSGHWQFDPIEVQSRRELFWEIFAYDSLQCLTFGRPPSFVLSHVDCKPPHLISNLSDEHAFHAWKHRFTSECMSLLHNQAFGARTPTYSTVLQLDKKVRDFPVPPDLQMTGIAYSESRPPRYTDTVALVLQKHVVLAIRETNLLYLHRGFFARAITDYPEDPLRSPYRDSVVAAYRSAQTLVELMRNLHSRLEAPCERIWFLWAHMFSCSIILGSIVTRCPSMNLARSALNQLDLACELFSKAAPGFRATKVLEIMLRLQQKAHRSLEEYRRGYIVAGQLSASSSGTSTGDSGNDELAMLRGNVLPEAKTEQSSPRNHGSPSPSLTTQSDTSSNAANYMQSYDRFSSTANFSLPGSQSLPHGQSVPDAGLAVFQVHEAPMVNPYQTNASSWVAQTQPQELQAMHHDFSPTGPQHSSGDTECSATRASSAFPWHPSYETSHPLPQHFQAFNHGEGQGSEDRFLASSVPGTPLGLQQSYRAPESDMHLAWQNFVNNLQLS